MITINSLRKIACINMYIRVWNNLFKNITYEGRLDELNECDNLSNESITKIECIGSILVIWIN